VTSTRTALLLAGLALAALSLSACGHDIGDDCRSSADCDPNGTRACDLSQPGGYCTIVGCDEHACPSGSWCIRYFPEMYLTKECTPAPLDATGPFDEGCNADELCLASERSQSGGFCAKRSSEQRQCAINCSDASDCRGGYQCRKTGSGGAVLLSTNPTATMVNFCAPLTN
jgi:hypothetical protein